MQSNVDTDINADASSGAVSVRDKVTLMREAKMQNSALANIDTMDYQSRKSEPAACQKLLPAQLPVNQNFFLMQKDVRAPFRGEAVSMPGANSADAEPRSNHTENVVEFMKQTAAVQSQLPQHVKADPVKPSSDAKYAATSMQARQLRERIMQARKLQLLNYETSSAMPSVLARPYSLNCREAEREKSAATHTDGNEEAYKVVSQLNASAMGYTDTSASGAQAEADLFNARQRAAALGSQTQQSKTKIAVPQADAADQSTQ